MNSIIKAYLKRLTNLSSRNKSLLLSSLPSEQFFDLHEADFLLSKSSFDLLGQLLAGKARIPLCDMQDPRMEKVNEASKKLRKIARTERFIEEERGTRDLYVGYPFVRGKFSDGSVVHAPLLFFPVTLRLDQEQWCLMVRDDADTMLNRSFALAYSHFNEVAVPDEILEKTFEDFPKDSLEFRTGLYEWLKGTPFRINFNQKLFENLLHSFEKLKSSDLQALEKNGELKLYPEAVLGIFPQAGSYLVPDYQYLLTESENNLLRLPLFPSDADPKAEESEAGETTPIQPNRVREEQILTPFPVDLSQENVIRLVKQGESVVVQGPPGTGKSQLICNLMADFAAQGKRVLLVCQKRAALDVVYQRLQTLGLDPFAALIHDFRNDRGALYRQLATQIEKVDEYRQQNYSLDVVFLDREFTQESRLIDQVVGELEEFKKALFDESECGVSVKELYLTSDGEGPMVDLRSYYRNFPLDGSGDFTRRIKSYFTYRQRLGSDHSWQERKSFAGYSLSDLQRMEEALIGWPKFYFQLQEKFVSITSSEFSTDYLANPDDTIENIDDLLSLVSDKTAFRLFQEYLQSGLSGLERQALLRQVVDSLEGWKTDGVGIEESLRPDQLPAFRGQLAKALEAKSSSLSGRWWEWLGKEKAAVSSVAKSNGLSTEWSDLQKLEICLKNRIELESWLSNPLIGGGAGYLNKSLSFEDRYLLYFQQSEKAADAVLRLGKEPWAALFQKLALECSAEGQYIEYLKELKSWLETWQSNQEQLATFLSNHQQHQLLAGGEHYVQRLLTDLRRDFDSLVEMDKLWMGFSPTEQEISLLLNSGMEKEVATEQDVVQLFDNSLRLAWIEHIEQKYPMLRAVSSLKMDQWEEQLQASILRKQGLSKDITLMKLREATYRNLENNRLGNRVTYRELYHQVTKKRKIWPIRKVIEEFTEEVFDLVPCWMASPEAVSTLFPMKSGMFDLVIFDEASQCYAEYSLPAVYRGNQIVVTGDSKQLPPSDLYRVRFEENTEEEIPVAIEIDSLLDLAAQSLPSRQLTGHYRSSSLDLIDFSNQHFYKNSLRLLPDYEEVNDSKPGIEYLYVQGVWEKNANQIEAERVAVLVQELAESALTIGIVTFNYHQQQLIQDTLENKGLVVSDLFVKNIENVQGDERDVIIFSLGYAPDSRGRLAMQFGTLNQQGGENRLNVAITRARRRIYIVTSLWPEQLQTEQAANEGPKLLRAYLQYAREVSEGKYHPVPFSTHGFGSRWLLKDQIAAKNADYIKELPFADLTFRPDGTYEGLLLTDDDIYFGSTSAKEPHAYLPIILKTKNWPFRRIYSREHWRKQVEQLL